MSFSAQNWAWEQRCKTGIAKIVLLYLANCADRNGECFPGILTIVKNVQHTERAVRQAILDLLERHQIEAERQWMENGRCTSTRYRLPVAVDHCGNAGVAPTPVETQDHCGNAGVGDYCGNAGVTPAESQGGDYCGNAGVTPAESQGGDYCGNAGETPAESQGNPINLTKEEEKTPPLPPAGGGDGVRKQEIDEWFDEFWELYPRKQDKGRAYRAYLKAMKATRNDPDDVLDALSEAKADDHRFKGEPRYIPQAASFLNSGPWHAPDYLKTKPPSVLERLTALREAAHAC
jgi:hypothetical protein